MCSRSAGAMAPASGNSGSDDANAIIFFSSRGPCSDGRIKPDLAAPGTHVSGGVPQASATGPVGDGDALACFLEDGSGVSGGVGTNGGINLFFPDGQQFYTASSGTSHSTPCVAGGCALVRQYFINNSNTPPSPAMTKAFLMNSARYMTGLGANDTLWSESQGMGEMDLGMAFDGTPRILRDEASADTFTISGQTRVFAGVVGDKTKPCRVTLAWTDSPGSTAGNAYNNDLDLTVVIGGETYKGNVFSRSNSITGGVADTKNNVESVFLPAGVSGGFTVTVTAANINSIGVPNPGNDVSQDFALVIYNVGAGPSLAAAGYTLTNGACGNSVVYPGELITANLALQNAGTLPTTNLVASLLSYLVYQDETVQGIAAPADVLAGLLASNAIAFPSGPQTYGALAPGTEATNMFSFFADGTCGQTIAATLQLQDGTNDLGTVSYSFQLGLPFSTTIISQDFDGATNAALPTGWSNSASSGITPWATTSNTNDGTTTAAYCPDAAFPGEDYLYSPTFTLPIAEAYQLSFRNDFNLEPTYDGGVLEIAIGSKAIATSTFTDILAAGGSFVVGGYNGGLSDQGDRGSDDNPLLNRQAWTGNSDGYITTIVNLPAAASGTNIQLRWICGTDRGNGALEGIGGWWIDDIAINQPSFDCANCAPTNGLPNSAASIVFPANGYEFTTISPVVVVAG